MTDDQLLSGWSNLRSEVKQEWPNLTDVEIESINGKVERLSASLQDCYGYTIEEASNKIDDFLDKF